MGKKEKLIARLKSQPKDFTFEEAETLLGFLSYERSNCFRIRCSNCWMC